MTAAPAGRRRARAGSRVDRDGADAWFDGWRTLHARGDGETSHPSAGADTPSAARNARRISSGVALQQDPTCSPLPSLPSRVQGKPLRGVRGQVRESPASPATTDGNQETPPIAVRYRGGNGRRSRGETPRGVEENETASNQSAKKDDSHPLLG